MSLFPYLSDLERLPKPADPDRAVAELEVWRQRAKRDSEAADDAALAKFVLQVNEDSAGRALLEAIFGNSPFLSQCLQREPGLLRATAQRGLDETFAGLLSGLASEAPWRADRETTMAALRVAKRRVALVVALADIAGAWSLSQVTGALSSFAEAALGVGLSQLLHEAARAGVLALPHPDEPQRACGLVVLGMGKFGARELNYSSDIDLIVLFDPERVETRGADDTHQVLHRMVRELVAIMGARTREGYVFRTDLRLRPDTGATPLAVSTAVAEYYYESLGQNWERAAMIKARPVAGDLETGAVFLKRLIPFIWRKHLDFAAIQDIHSIKRQINAHKGHHEIAVAGHNIKVGRGGIREIEFFAQTQQLIWGGRIPELRLRATCAALEALARAGRTDPGAVRHLIVAYEFLRKLEHRLQMIADEQTHTLPEDPAGLAAIARFMGFADAETFSRHLTEQLTQVERHYAELFEDAPELGGAEGNLVFTGTDDDPDTLRTLEELGFSDGAAVSSCVRGWHHGRIRATRSTRARELLTELMPALLSALGRSVNPDAAFMKFNEFLTNLPSGVQLFSLFYSNPGLLDQLAEIMGSAPRLAEHLSRYPNLFEGILTGDFYQPLPGPEALTADLGQALDQAADFQDVLDVVRRWTHDREFQVGMQLLRNLIAGDQAGAALSRVADTVLQALLPLVEREFARQHGRLPGGAYVIVGLGKLGGREMTFESDLDLIFIYQASQGLDTPSDGDRPLAASQYYARLSQRLTSAVSAMTPEGRLYEIDTRLRPSGQAGPVASEIDGFEAYQRRSAWTWEHMALTRARIIAGSPALAERVRGVMRDAITRQRDPATLARDVADMRERIDRERHTDNPWRLKHVRGGLLDLDFVAQYLQLRHCAAHPEVLAPATTEAFERLGRAGVIAPSEAAELTEMSRFLVRLQALLRLTVGTSRNEARFPAGLGAALSRAAGVEDFAALKARLREVQQRIRGSYVRLVEAAA